MKQLSLTTVKNAIKQWKTLQKEQRWRIINPLNKPGRKMSNINAYLSKYLPDILEAMDKEGMAISAKTKFETVRTLIVSPQTYDNLFPPNEGPSFDPDEFLLSNLSKSVRDYHNSEFLAKIYPTSNHLLSL